MAQQIKKKYLSDEVINYFDDQINAVESGLEQELIDRAGADASTLTSANAYADAQDVINLGLAQDYTDQEYSALETALSGSIASVQGEVDQVEIDLAAEVTRATAAEASLQSEINTEKGRIDAILLAADADKDSFAEIVTLVNSIDTENDQAFAGYVLSNNAALAQEVSDRQAADATNLQAAKDYADQKISEIPSVDLSGYYTKEEVDAKESALQSDISDLDVYAQDIRSDVDSLEVYAQDIRSDVDANTLEIAGHESRLDALEALTDGPSFSNGSVIVGEELGFVDLDKEYIKLMSCAVGRMAIHEGEDYTVSVVAGKTRLTWIGSLVNPGGAEAMETGDKVFFVGAY